MEECSVAVTLTQHAWILRGRHGFHFSTATWIFWGKGSVFTHLTGRGADVETSDAPAESVLSPLVLLEKASSLNPKPLNPKP